MEEQIEIKKQRVVIVAMDGSKESEAALDFYVQKIHREDDDVIACHVIHHPSSYVKGPEWEPVPTSTVKQAYETEMDKSNTLCTQINERLKEKGINGRVMQTTGDPGHKIVKAAKEFGATLIVVGSRGLSKIRRTLIGSVSDYVVHHSHVPVFVCRQQKK